MGLAELPGWAKSRWGKPLNGEGGDRHAPRRPAAGERIPAGKRHDALKALGGAMRRRGATEEEIFAAFLAMSLGRFDPPESEDELRKQARDFAARYAPEPPDPLAGVAVRTGNGFGFSSRLYREGTETEFSGGAGGGGEPPPAPEFGPPVPASQLRRLTDEQLWLWKGYLSRGGITLLSALWKAGKTTLLSYLLRAVANPGQFLGQPVQPARVLYVTEEHESLWAERRDEVGIADHVDFLVRPFTNKPATPTWLSFLSYLAGVCRGAAYDLIVFDTLSNLWPVRDENDNAKVQEALMPLRAVSAAAAFLLVHHVRKGDGEEATASRGAGALPAFCDTLVEFRRYLASDRKDRRRVLTGYGRHRETPDEVVAQWRDNEYVLLGDRADVSFRELGDVLDEILPGRPPGLDYEEIGLQWPGDSVPRKARLLDALRQGTESGRWRREGTGKKGSPFTYWRPREEAPPANPFDRGD
jgi:hypothetical protein